MQWKAIDGGKPRKGLIEVFLRGICEKGRLLNIVRNFIVYEKDKESKPEDDTIAQDGTAFNCLKIPIFHLVSLISIRFLVRETAMLHALCSRLYPAALMLA